MRVCILGTSRSGTTSLMKYAYLSLNLLPIVEPYNKSSYRKHSPQKRNEYMIWEQPKVLVKHLISQVPKDKLYKLQDYHDKVVLIHRVNIYEASESWVAAVMTQRWDKDYNYESSLSSKDQKEVQAMLKKEIQRRKWLADRVKELNYFTTTYEDIFINGKDRERLKKYLEISDDTYSYLLNSDRRLRKPYPIKKGLL
jgi:hypothetical protein